VRSLSPRRPAWHWSSRTIAPTRSACSQHWRPTIRAGPTLARRSAGSTSRLSPMQPATRSSAMPRPPRTRTRWCRSTCRHCPRPPFPTAARRWLACPPRLLPLARRYRRRRWPRPRQPSQRPRVVRRVHRFRRHCRWIPLRHRQHHCRWIPPRPRQHHCRWIRPYQSYRLVHLRRLLRCLLSCPYHQASYRMSHRRRLFRYRPICRCCLAPRACLCRPAPRLYRRRPNVPTRRGPRPCRQPLCQRRLFRRHR